jgi:hypothetical protein
MIHKIIFHKSGEKREILVYVFTAISVGIIINFVFFDYILILS